MLYFKFTSLLTSSVIEGGQSSGSSTANATADATLAGEQVSGVAAGMPFFTLVVYALLIFALYWFMFRPQKKREKELIAMQKALGTGDNVLTSSGMFGKIVDVGEDAFIVEFGTNRGVRIPIRKADIIANRTPKLTPQAPAEIPEK